MDDLLSEFLTETSESLSILDVQLVKFEQDPSVVTPPYRSIELVRR